MQPVCHTFDRGHKHWFLFSPLQMRSLLAQLPKPVSQRGRLFMREQHLHTQLSPENDLRSPLMEGYLGAVNHQHTLQSSGKQLLWIKTKKAKRSWQLQRKHPLVSGRYQALVLTSAMQKLWCCLLYQHEMSLFSFILLTAFHVKPQQPRH